VWVQFEGRKGFEYGFSASNDGNGGCNLYFVKGEGGWPEDGLVNACIDYVWETYPDESENIYDLSEKTRRVCRFESVIVALIDAQRLLKQSVRKVFVQEPDGLREYSWRGVKVIGEAHREQIRKQFPDAKIVTTLQEFVEALLP